MKNFKNLQFYLIIILFSGLFLNSCNKNNENEKPANEYFISTEVKSNITTQDALANFIKLSPDAAGIGFFLKSDVEVQKIVYKTTFKNKNIQASGLVCMPKTPGDYPIFSFQNGTNTLHSDAPSVAFGSSFANYNDLYQVLASVASMGFIVVVPDYIGFGASSNQVHPYLNAASSTQCILDMLRATKELCNVDTIAAKPTNDLFLFGYSQGGWATMQLQKTIEKNYSSEFSLKASSCGAGPYSIEYMNEFIISQTTYPMPYFLTYLLNSYNSLELMTNPLSDFIQAPYAALIPSLYDGEHSGGAINSALTTKMADLLTPEYRTSYATSSKFTGIKAAFLANSIAAWPTTTPTKLYHGADDVFIPLSSSQKMLADFKTAGVTDSQMQLVIIPGTDHQTAIFPVGMQTILWFLTLK